MGRRRIASAVFLAGIMIFGLINFSNRTPQVEGEFESSDAVGVLANVDHSRLLARAVALSEPEMPRGVKRVAYSALYNVKMYRATGDDKYGLRAAKYTRYLISLQEENGMWREVPGEPPSSYFVLESSMATWAVSEAYLAGIVSDREARRSILGGGDHILWKAGWLTSLGYKMGLKPNALAFMAIALSRAHLATREMHEETGDPEALSKAERYRAKAIEISDALIEMQNSDGSWYDGPYNLPFYEWKSTSAWYQSMTWSGIAYTYSILEDSKNKGEYLRSIRKGIRWTEKLRRSDGGYNGIFYPNGTFSDDGEGSIMLLQGFAIAGLNGIDAAREFMSLSDHTAEKFSGWSANLSFAHAVMLEAFRDSRRSDRRFR